VRRRHLGVVLAASAVAVALDGLAFAMLFRALDPAVPIASAVFAQVTLLFVLWQAVATLLIVGLGLVAMHRVLRVAVVEQRERPVPLS
jgi:hypothetical protein